MSEGKADALASVVSHFTGAAGASSRKAAQETTQPDPLPKRFQALPGPVGKPQGHFHSTSPPPLPDEQVGGGSRCDGSGGRACPPMGSGATARSGGAASRQRAGGRGASERPSHTGSSSTAWGDLFCPLRGPVNGIGGMPGGSAKRGRRPKAGGAGGGRSPPRGGDFVHPAKNFASYPQGAGLVKKPVIKKLKDS